MSVAGFRPGLGRGGITHSLLVIDPVVGVGVVLVGEAGVRGDKAGRAVTMLGGAAIVA